MCEQMCILVSFILRTLIPLRGPHSHSTSKPNYLPKSIPSHIITMGIRTSTYKFWGVRHSIQSITRRPFFFLSYSNWSSQFQPPPTVSTSQEECSHHTCFTVVERGAVQLDSVALSSEHPYFHFTVLFTSFCLHCL